MRTISQRRKALGTLPTDLYKSFEGIIARIRECPPGEAKLGMQVLMWLHFAYRPLKLAELQHALAVEEGDAEFDVDNIPSQKALLDCCLGLVIVDEETLTVRFVHYTLEEYFRENIENIFPNGCSYIAETCLTYLNFGGLREHCASIDSLLAKMKKYIFLGYAAFYWGNHIQQQCNGDVTKLAEMIVDHEIDCPPCAIQALYYQVCNTYNWLLTPPGPIVIAKKFSGIHMMAYFGLSKYISHFCRVGRYMDLKDEADRTPLAWATACGHESSVKILISWGDIDTHVKVDINAADKKRRTPLSLAAWKGKEAIVRLLLERDDIDINAVDNRGRSPFTLAANRGHEAIVRLLIIKDLDVNATDNYGWTPLSWVAWKGNEAVLRLLIERDDININAADKRGQTPFALAVKEGHEAVLRLLIERDDIDINAADKRGQTPFALAAKEGHEAIVRLLIERDEIDINAPNKHGQTPFALAAERGHEGVVRLLIERTNVDVNVANERGQTPFALAAERGHEAVVRLLIMKDLNVNATDKDGRTPLTWAACNGHETIVRSLIERGDIDIKAADKSGRTPFASAVEGGHEGVVRLLVETGGLGIDALFWAADKGHGGAVKLLIESFVDIDAKDNHGRTPFSLAANRGHEDVHVGLVIQRNGVDINAAGKDGWKPLPRVTQRGYRVVVLLNDHLGVRVWSLNVPPTGLLNQSSQRARRRGPGHGRRRPRIGPRARR